MKGKKRSHLKLPLALTGAVALIVGSYVYMTYAQGSRSPLPVEHMQMAKGSASAPIFTWSTTDLGEDETGQPNTKISLFVQDSHKRELPVGTYKLSCKADMGVPKEPNEATVPFKCFFAGGGEELHVIHNSDGSYAVTQNDLDEGSAEVPGSVGASKTLLTFTTS